MKAAPVMSALRHRSALQTLVHTGQHYDGNMSQIFFRQLELPSPDVNLEVGSGSHAVQTAHIMMRLEEVLQERRPEVVLVYGDVNSTVAAALVCAKLLVPLGHVEAGLRSFDRTMPEEINRLVTDQIADLLFTPSSDGDVNLLREGVSADRLHFVGNVMIDSLIRLLPAPRAEEEPYALVTLHRPSNVDEPEMLGRLMRTLSAISTDIPVIFPLHPRTRQRLAALGLSSSGTRLRLVEPCGYQEFLSLERAATVVITDSGGVQEETTFLGVPCLTVRENTERPVTVEIGTNILVGRDMDHLRDEVAKIRAGAPKQGTVPPLWDGHASDRIADALEKWWSAR
jgi:UDP-N-acetylglucosamine 2-epimerase (non-hydrolysing)